MSNQYAASFRSRFNVLENKTYDSVHNIPTCTIEEASVWGFSSSSLGRCMYAQQSNSYVLYETLRRNDNLNWAVYSTLECRRSEKSLKMRRRYTRRLAIGQRVSGDCPAINHWRSGTSARGQHARDRDHPQTQHCRRRRAGLAGCDVTETSCSVDDRWRIPRIVRELSSRHRRQRN